MGATMTIDLDAIRWRYECWTEDEAPQMIAREWFISDTQAVAWFQAEHPATFARGAEMRVYDR